MCGHLVIALFAWHKAIVEYNKRSLTECNKNMYVDSATYLSHGKPYKRHLLRHSFRKDGKVKKKTIASLCGLSEEEVGAIKLALKHKKDLQSLQSIKAASVMQGKSYGAILTLQKIAKEMGITNALGNTDNGKMALWQVIGRALFQG